MADPSRTIHGLLYTALKALLDMDPDLYNKCEQEYDQSCFNRQHEFDQRQRRWELIEHQAIKSSYSDGETNHIVDDQPPRQQHQELVMQIDSIAAIPVLERFSEEAEHQYHQTDMPVDAASPPAT